MIQSLIIGILLITAIFYLGRMVVLSLRGKASCGGGCAKCAVTETAKSNS